MCGHYHTLLINGTSYELPNRISHLLEHDISSKLCNINVSASTHSLFPGKYKPEEQDEPHNIYICKTQTRKP